MLYFWKERVKTILIGKGKENMKRKIGKVPGKAVLIPLVLVVLAVYYYIALPAINIHNTGIWKFILGALIIGFLVVAVPHAELTGDRKRPVKFHLLQKGKPMKVLLACIILAILAYVVGTVLSSPIINAKKYQHLMKVELEHHQEVIITVVEVLETLEVLLLVVIVVQVRMVLVGY